jgi:putative salt-induced outer membrane protein YdiY
MERRTAIALWSALLATAFALTSRAAETNKWETSAAAGVTLTSGNSDTFLGTISLKSERKAERDEILLGASGTYGTTEEETDVTLPSGRVVTKDETETTTANAQGFGQYNHLFTERFYAGVRLDLLHDKIADVKYRVTVSPLVGYYVIKNPTTRLSFEAGPSFVAEKQGDDRSEFVALRLAERFEHKLSDTARIWQSVEFLPEVSDFNNYIINAEIGAEAALTKKLSLRGVIQDTYDNEPADDRKKNDLKLITSLVYKF